MNDLERVWASVRREVFVRRGSHQDLIHSKSAGLPEDLPPSPSGVVTFFDGLGGGILGEAILLPSLISDNNDVEFTTSSLSLGDHTIYAVLLGPSGLCPVIPSASQHVNPPPASPSITGVGSSANPSNYGQNVTFTATVARQGGGAVSGTVQFKADGSVKAVFAQDAYYLASSDSDSTIVYAFPSRGAFAVGDRSAASGASVTFFGAQWDSANSLSGGAAPNAFKGYATAPGSPPSCGGSFTADPGNSGSPPASVPSYMGTLVTSRVTKSGSNIVGSVTRIVVVKTSSYGPSPGAGGKGTVVAVVC